MYTLKSRYDSNQKGNFIYELVSYGDEKRSKDDKKQINKTVSSAVGCIALFSVYSM